MAALVGAIHDFDVPSMVPRDSYNVFIATYMMANRRHGTIYIGVCTRRTSTLTRCVWMAGTRPAMTNIKLSYA